MRIGDFPKPISCVIMTCGCVVLLDDLFCSRLYGEYQVYRVVNR